MRKKEDEIVSAHQREYGKLTAQLDKQNILKSSIHYELKEMDSLDLDQKKLSMDKSRNNIQKLEIELANKHNLIEVKKNILQNIDTKNEEMISSLKDKLEFITKQLIEIKETKEGNKRYYKNEYDGRLLTLRNECDSKVSDIEKLIKAEKRRLDLNPFIEQHMNEAAQELEFYSLRVNNTQDKITAANRKANEMLVGMLNTQEKLERKEEIIKKLSDLESSLSVLERNIVDFNFLVKAFDRTGIPVLKLENSASEITVLANELLRFFDNDFSIAFETTRLTKDKKKLKEVFDINVIDDEGECELKNKSGGESVWIETSIQLALGILLRKQGRVLETSFLDEQDGALDMENALNYRRMIESAHKLSGVYHTIIITHRPELIDLIEQKIILGATGISLHAA